ncbi:hypothetical protein GCM10017764_19150 [Sphingobacterium griseoflavum]|uniref:Uncharacterized protein n=1 Tax=Sphingobacterium griseoflavum TaxID=1474952 RepID=A0ABQ3HYL5_9SPHI|nr:hypothetical protein GCM10017764_19150 [Sphingobacterium griseoflavum]
MRESRIEAVVGHLSADEQGPMCRWEAAGGLTDRYRSIYYIGDTHDEYRTSAENFCNGIDRSSHGASDTQATKSDEPEW